MKTNKIFKAALFCMAALVNLCAGCGRTEETVLNLLEEPSVNSLMNPEETVIQETEIAEEKDAVCVYVCGGVVNPGIYELPPGSRIYEAVNLAGGLTEDADELSLNQAETLSDGQKLYVPLTGEKNTVMQDVESNAPVAGQSVSNRVNINTADLKSLMTLSGVGESRAKSIIAYREDVGKFCRTEDIMNVTGIKEGLYEKIKDQITVN